MALTTKGRILKKPSKLSEVEPRTNQVTSSKQWEMLVRFLEKHPAIATCTFITNNAQRVVARRLWNDISVVLNKLEAAYHSSEQWKRVWKDMKYKVKSKLEHNSQKKRKQDWLKLTPHEQRIANILQRKTVRNRKLEVHVNSGEQNDDNTLELGINDVHNGTGKDGINAYEVSLSPSQYQPIEHTDTQEESQMCIAKSLQVICQQNKEILFLLRKTYDLKVVDSKKRQAYQSTKLAMYQKKLEIMQTRMEMDKLAYSS